MFNSKIPLPLSILGRDGIEMLKIDEHTIAVRLKWISVKDKLPNNEQWVLCFDGSIKIKMFEKFDDKLIFYDGDTDYSFPSGRIDDITHWMPLPKPPNE